MFSLTCPHCHSPVNLPDNPWGRSFNCNWCRHVFTVPRHAPEPPPTAPGFLGWLWKGQGVWLLGAALAGATLLVVLFVRWTGPAPLPDRKEVADELRQATADQVRAKLGAPDEVREPATADGNGHVLWIYRNRTRNPETGQPDPELFIWFQDGRVSQVLDRPHGKILVHPQIDVRRQKRL
jgi:hypothetical protein